MNKYLFICVIIFTSTIFVGCGRQNISNNTPDVINEKTPDSVTIENEIILDAHVGIYVKSLEISNIVKKIDQNHLTGPYRIYGDLKTSEEEGSTMMTIEYFPYATEDLLALLREESTDGIVYGEKQMWEAKALKKKNILFVEVWLSPIELLK